MAHLVSNIRGPGLLTITWIRSAVYFEGGVFRQPAAGSKLSTDPVEDQCMNSDLHARSAVSTSLPLVGREGKQGRVTFGLCKSWASWSIVVCLALSASLLFCRRHRLIDSKAK